MSVRFDPRDFIGPPYWRCPQCSEQTFGVYQIGAQGYSRRCRTCWTKADYPLWPLSRKVIYVDQWAISNMTKALNRAIEAHSRAAANPFWLELFEALERACKLQLVICPYSQVHRHESMLSAYYEPLKRMYEQLSHGVSFDSPEQISQRQLNTALLAWMKNERPAYDFDPERVTNGGLNDWKERYIISVRGMEYPTDVVQGIRQYRDAVTAGVRDVFKYYQSNPHSDFEYWWRHERNAGKNAIIGAARLYAERVREMAATGEFSLNRLYSSIGFDQYRLIMEVLRGSGVSTTDLAPRMIAFLDSEIFKDYPSSRISTLIWAAIARKAALGQKKIPNTGMMNDIVAVSTYLPYCDAMLIDNECRGLWESIPSQYRNSYSTRLYSYNTRQQFLNYLHEIEESAESAVLTCVRQVYGEPRPFFTMYEERHDAGQTQKPERAR